MPQLHLITSLLSGAVLACSPASRATTITAARAGLPIEVTTLLQRWEMCWHFAGEEPYDAARAQEIEDGQAEWCPDNDAERARLQAKWKDDRPVQEALRKLDEMQ